MDCKGVGSGRDEVDFGREIMESKGKECVCEPCRRDVEEVLGMSCALF
jgi:hypothetical protein